MGDDVDKPIEGFPQLLQFAAAEKVFPENDARLARSHLTQSRLTT